MDHALVCQSCGARHDPGLYVRGCPDCRERGEHGRLEVVPGGSPVDPLADPSGDPFEDESTSEPLPDQSPDEPLVDLPVDQSMWRYRHLLPLLPDDPVTLGEGLTPLVRAETVAPDTDVDVWLKNETVNPTHSFKDRLNSLLVSNAAALGADRFALSSTGNHGASTAAYARRAGADATVVLVPRETEPPLRRQIAAHGAAVAVTDVDARRDLLDALVDRGWYPTVNVTDPYTGRPYGYEAYRTIAFELVEQLGGAPDVVAVPTGIGDGLYGTWLGFRDLAAWGVVDEPPRMLAAQSDERAPLVRAVDREAGTVGTDDGPLPATLSTAGRTAGDHALRALDESGGEGVAVPADEVEAAIRAAGRAGVFVEPASALAPAAVERAVAEGLVDADETAVCVATGAGVKWPAATADAVGEAPVIEPTLEALDAAVDVDVT